MISDFFREVWRFFLLYLIRPVALLFGALITSVYRALFAWWLDGWTFKGRQARFERDISKEYSWIFDRYNARIVPMRRYRQVRNYTNMTIAVGDLLVQFTRGHDDFHASVAPAHAPHDWYDFGEAIDLVLDGEPTRKSAKNYRMSDFQLLFEANIERLNRFFSKEEYGQSRRDRTVQKLTPL